MNNMQQDSESYKTAIHDVLDIPLSKPLSSTENRQLERIRQNLLILNQLASLIWMHIIIIIVICAVSVVLLYQLQWFIWTRNFDSYFDYMLLLAILSIACMVIYLTRVYVFKLGFKLKRFFDINEKLINEGV